MGLGASAGLLEADAKGLSVVSCTVDTAFTATLSGVGGPASPTVGGLAVSDWVGSLTLSRAALSPWPSCAVPSLVAVVSDCAAADVLDGSEVVSVVADSSASAVSDVVVFSCGPSLCAAVWVAPLAPTPRLVVDFVFDASAESVEDESADDESEADDEDESGDAEEDDDDEPEVSADAMPQPSPVSTAVPTPNATASPPTLPTYAAPFMCRANPPRIAWAR
jgi:hypothetical protein